MNQLRYAVGAGALLLALAPLGMPSVRTPLVKSSSHAQPPARTTVVILGSGTPIPDPDRFGPAVAIVVDSVAYLFDAGSGVVRRAAAAARDGLPPLTAPRLGRLFLTHLHSDHTMGVNDVIFTPWIQGRRQPLEIYGPPGTQRLVSGILDGNREDIEVRMGSAGGPSAEGWKANVHEIAEGEVYRDARITVRAFEVPHSTWKHAFGYRITTSPALFRRDRREARRGSAKHLFRHCHIEPGLATVLKRQTALPLVSRSQY